jgi:hypothetical protein
VILLVGSEGAQGKRYQAILKYLGKDFRRVDEIWGEPTFDDPSVQPAAFSGIILATPTDTHIDQVRRYLGWRVPILVEKPFSKDVDALKALEPEANGVPLSLVMQYRHLAIGTKQEPSFYDYFRHGNDGLTWDCLQTIALAKGPVRLSEASPVWNCVINGHMLNIADMDGAYIREVQDWLSGRHQSFSVIIDIHEKVRAFGARR